MKVPTDILKRLVQINHPALKDHAFTRVEIDGPPGKRVDPLSKEYPGMVRVIHVTIGDLVRDLIEARE